MSAEQRERWKADEAEMRDRRMLADRVGTDLPRQEQEMGIAAFGDADRFQVTTYVPTMVRHLLRHAHAKIEWLYIGVPDGRNRRVDSIPEARGVEDAAEIEGIKATLPIGTLSIKGRPRASDRFSHIVTTPDRSGRVEEVFGNE